jgi:hypothetical protein
MQATVAFLLRGHRASLLPVRGLNVLRQNFPNFRVLLEIGKDLPPSKFLNVFLIAFLGNPASISA